MTGLYLPGAKWRPISYRAAAGKFTRPPLGYIVHVPVSNGSLFAYFDGLVSPARKFCTAFIFKDGTSEQYTTLDMKAWAQGDGNDDYWSFEVEGFPNEPMTGPQLDTLATWHKFLDVAGRIATAPGQKGVGTHQMGGKAWGGHSCPGAIRTAQLPQIIQRANSTNQEDDMQLSDKVTVGRADGKGTEDVPLSTMFNRLQFVYGEVLRQRATEAAQTAAIKALAESKGADAAAITAAVVAKINALEITLTPKES